MTRAARFLTWSGIIGVLFVLATLSIVPVPLVSEETKEKILPVLPWWLLVSFGSYCLWSLGWGLITFRDADEAYTELLSEITQAKDDLRSKGITVD
ncbi:dolichol-phosphate mannosyltransferase subunit 3 [Rickenella mellea]|uniref:Dolichol-phosphate mannosyltransferase subunit 3 n=1 Tax=Rickenella mellea TaxID=50990 RepID=A0A4Y7Q223_9AGAM|nr:dolichol-phosphate mannosyltransferase subunit 3 [Rickenella mellea]